MLSRTDSEERRLDLSRQLIYSQMMVPLKVSVLSQKIAEAYLHVSNEFIMPAQRCAPPSVTHARGR